MPNSKKTSNIERPTSNVEWEKAEKQTYDEERSDIIIRCSMFKMIVDIDYGQHYSEENVVKDEAKEVENEKHDIGLLMFISGDHLSF